MRTFSTFLLAVCAAAALTAHAPAQQITTADKASVDTLLKTCATQIAAMKKDMAAHGESATQEELRGFFEPLPAQLREMAESERMSVADVLREAVSRTRQAMNDPASTDPSDKVIGPTMICFLELLIAREAAQPTRLPAPQPAAGGGAPATDRKLQAFRTLCGDEARKVSAVAGVDYLAPQANGVAHMDEAYTDFSSDPEGRRTAKAQFHEAMAASTEAFYRARLGLAACAIYFTEASEIGIPLKVMERQWSEERVEVYALNGEPPARVPAPAPAPAPTPPPAAPTAQPVADSGGCITIDWGAGGQGDPAVLRNVCGHALNVGVCIKVATPGSASETVSCEQSRFSSYHLRGRSAVTVPATHGTVHSRVCTPPQVAALWWENGKSVGNCR